MYLTKDLVKLDEHVSEQSVVQIDFYPERDRNLALLKSFVFTHNAPSGKCSTIGILNKLREAAIADVLGNCFCIIANYGHGKSHFGLVLANYFGRDVNSEEFKVVMDKIRHAVDNEVHVRNLQEFRESRAPYLVIRLRGDRPEPLDQQFLQAVKTALGEQGVSERLPLWFESAGKWLQKLSQDAQSVEKANRFLEESAHTDLPMLTQKVLDYDHGTYDIVTELHRYLYGTTPNFEGDFGVDKILRWLVDHYCKEQRQFGGILVLFDEFSLFVQNYTRSRTRAGTLQSFLEAIDSRRQYSLFVAFAQHDPHNVINSAAASAEGPHEIDNLRKELERIPISNKLLLYSRMEQVINGYLKQDDGLWKQIRRENSEFDNALSEANSLARQAFPKTYTEDQDWSPEEFEESVTKGCFPLHPLTTAILCNAELVGEEAHIGTPRTVLGFVYEQVHSKLDQSVVREGFPNWIYPVAIVDYFEEMLPQDKYAQYREAIQRIEGEPTDPQLAVLKAILLISMAEIPTYRQRFVELVSHLCGYDLSVVRETLFQLANDYVLFYDDNGRYRFWTSGGNVRKLIEHRNREMAKPITAEDIQRINQRFGVLRSVNVSWGHPDDWQAEETVLWRQDLTPERLRNMAPLFRVTQSGLQKPPRGRILRLLATTDTEIDEFREEAQHILDEAFPGEKAPAVLLVLPAECTPELPKLVRWENWLQQPNETREIGDEMLALERNDVRQKVEQAFKRFVEVSWSHGSFSPFVVPQAYRTVFQIQKPQGVDEAVALLYKDAYRFVPRFFEQYNHNSSKLRADVRQLCIKLAEDRLGEVVITFGNSPGKDCVHKYLQQEWGIVGFDYHVHPPKNGAVKHAWEFLDKEFSDKENAKPVGNVLISLMNPPFGYDYHQLALLFSAWYGYNRADIELNIGGRLANLNEIWEDKSVDRSEKFIEQLVYVKRVAIKRRDRDKEEQEIENLVQRVFSRQEFAQQEAREAVSRLQAYLQDDKHPENRREEARRAFEILSADLRRAEAYDQKAENLLRVASKETKLDRLVDAYMNPGLPTLGIVRAEQPDPKTILERFLERISERVEVSCQEAESLSKLEDVTKFTDRLRNVLALVKRTQSQELVDRVQRAIEEVNRKAEELRQEAEDKELLGELRAITRVITAETPLKTLRQYLQRLQAMAPKAQSTKELQQQTLQKIQNAIERSEEYLQQLQERFECAQGIDELERLRSEIARKWTHYEDTPECETLRGFEERCKQVVGLLGQIKNFAYPSCPEELPQVIGELERLASQSNHSAMQKAAAIKRGDIEAYVKQEEQEALDWLRGMKIQVEQAHAEELRDLLRRLDAPPSFLPESERACVQSLRQTVQKRIESDAFESVRIRLRDIRDREKLLQIKEEIERLLEKVT